MPCSLVALNSVIISWRAVPCSPPTAYQKSIVVWALATAARPKSAPDSSAAKVRCIRFINQLSSLVASPNRYWIGGTLRCHARSRPLRDSWQEFWPSSLVSTPPRVGKGRGSPSALAPCHGYALDELALRHEEEEQD